MLGHVEQTEDLVRGAKAAGRRDGRGRVEAERHLHLDHVAVAGGVLGIEIDHDSA